MESYFLIDLAPGEWMKNQLKEIAGNNVFFGKIRDANGKRRFSGVAGLI